MSSLCPGYIGVAKVDGQIIRCSDFGVNPNQKYSFYDHVIGLNDTVPSDNSTKNENIGVIQTQKRIGRPSVVSISGSFSFPAATDGSNPNFSALFNHAKYGTYFDLDFQYHRGGGQSSRKFSNCRVNQFSFSCTAGDTVNISVDVFAKDIDEGGGSVSSYQTAEKLITWDKVVVSASGVDSSSGVQGLEFTINNNLKNVYTTNAPGTLNAFMPYDIRVGMQEVTGSISVYDIPGNTILDHTTGSKTMSLTVASFSTNIEVVYEPQQTGGTLGPVITSVPFVGVDKPFGA